MITPQDVLFPNFYDVLPYTRDLMPQLLSVDAKHRAAAALFVVTALSESPGSYEEKRAFMAALATIEHLPVEVQVEFVSLLVPTTDRYSDREYFPFDVYRDLAYTVAGDAPELAVALMEQARTMYAEGVAEGDVDEHETFDGDDEYDDDED